MSVMLLRFAIVSTAYHIRAIAVTATLPSP
jgi:hypothetical protein